MPTDQCRQLSEILHAQPTNDLGDRRPLSVRIKERRKLVAAGITTMLDGVATEKRGLLASEDKLFTRAQAEIANIDVRIDELEEQEARTANANEARRLSGGAAGSSGWSVGTEARTYSRDPHSPSFFHDLRNSQRGDYAAAERLSRNNAEAGLETRALGNTGAAGGSGGDFAMPDYLLEDFVALQRPLAATWHTFHQEVLEPGYNSVIIPKVLTGTTAAAQTTQNTALSDTDPTTSSLTSNITTIGGKVVVSQQLLDQTPVGVFDRALTGDLSAAYAQALGSQALYGTNTGGQLNGYTTPSSTSITTWTQATPTAAGLYGQIAKTISTIQTTRFASPDTIVMHPRRWNWLASYTDSTGRPLVVPNSQGSMNSMAEPGAAAASGHVGTLLGLDVFVDPNISITTNSTQDQVLVYLRDDIWAWSSTPKVETFTQPYSDSFAVLYRITGYTAMIPQRYLSSLGMITGSGLTTPVFPS